MEISCCQATLSHIDLSCASAFAAMLMDLYLMKLLKSWLVDSLIVATHCSMALRVPLHHYILRGSAITAVWMTSVPYRNFRTFDPTPHRTYTNGLNNGKLGTVIFGSDTSMRLRCFTRLQRGPLGRCGLHFRSNYSMLTGDELVTYYVLYHPRTCYFSLFNMHFSNYVVIYCTLSMIWLNKKNE